MRGRRKIKARKTAAVRFSPVHKSSTFSRDRIKRRNRIIASIAVLVILFSLSYIVGTTLYIEDGSAWLDFSKFKIGGKVLLYVPPSPIKETTDKPKDEKPQDKPEVIDKEDGIDPAAVPARSKQVLYETLKDEILFDGFLDAALADGFDGIVIEYKDIEGTVYGITENAAVTETGALHKEALDLKAATDRIKQKGLMPVAKISCFKDNLAAVKYLPYAIKVHGGQVRWLDRDLKRWLNPAYKESRDYELSIIKDAAEGGFDCIYLYNVEFPVQVKSDLIEYPEEHKSLDKTDVIAGFLKDVKGALTAVSEENKSDRYCSLVVQLADKAFDDEFYEKKTGQDLSKISKEADSVLLNVTKPEETAKTLQALGIDSKEKTSALIAKNADIAVFAQYWDHIFVK